MSLNYRTYADATRVKKRIGGIFMLSRASLKEMNITSEQVDKIMEMHGASIEGLKTRTGKVKDHLVSQIKALKGEVTEAKDGSFKKKYEAESLAHKATAEALEVQKAAVFKYLTKEENASTDLLVRELLERGSEELGSLHPAALSKAIKSYDRSLVKRGTDGNIENHDEVLSHFANEWGDFFGKVQTQGVDVGSVHGQGARPAYTKDAIAKMSASEINQNWDLVRGALV